MILEKKSISSLFLCFYLVISFSVHLNAKNEADTDTLFEVYKLNLKNIFNFKAGDKKALNSALILTSKFTLSQVFCTFLKLYF